MICKKCKKVFKVNEMFGKGKLYCEKCYKEKAFYKRQKIQTYNVTSFATRFKNHKN